MTFYPDLSPYEYDEHDQPMLNVGWLDRDQPFPTGEVDRETYTRLVRLAAADRAVTRGWHDCPFCDERSPLPLPGANPESEVLLGHSEIWVESDDGTIYAAPTLVCHYVAAHGYLPPEAFLNAVRTGGPAPLDARSLSSD